MSSEYGAMSGAFHVEGAGGIRRIEIPEFSLIAPLGVVSTWESVNRAEGQSLTESDCASIRQWIDEFQLNKSTKSSAIGDTREIRHLSEAGRWQIERFLLKDYLVKQQTGQLSFSGLHPGLPDVYVDDFYPLILPAELADVTIPINFQIRSGDPIDNIAFIPVRAKQFEQSLKQDFIETAESPLTSAPIENLPRTSPDIALDQFLMARGITAKSARHKAATMLEPAISAVVREVTQNVKPRPKKKLPKKVRTPFSERHKNPKLAGLDIMSYLRKVYGSRVGTLTRNELRQRDRSAIEAVDNWLRTKDLPPDIPLPTKSALNDSTLEALLLPADALRIASAHAYRQKKASQNKPK